MKKSSCGHGEPHKGQDSTRGHGRQGKKKKRHTDLKKKKGDKVVINCGAAIT